MSDPRDAPAPEVVRAQRIELVDEGGTLRGLFGRLASPDPLAPVFGLTLFDPLGKPRVWLGLDVTGPSLVFDLGGNNLIVLGVNDPTADALHVGAYLHVSDLEGTPVLGWQVEENGSIAARLGSLAIANAAGPGR